MTRDPKEPTEGDFQFLGDRPQASLLSEFWTFLGQNKKWWLLPILIMMALFGILILLAGTSAAPFIYTLF